MVFDAPRKLALFSSLLLLVTAALTLVPDTWMLGNPACHSCHDATAPADHLLYRPNYLGYNSLCSFAPLSTLMLAGTAIIIFVTTFRIRFERWGRQYRIVGAAICFVLAALTLLPYDGPYLNLIGGSTLSALAPASTAFLLGLGALALMGFMVCPFMIIWRCRCPPLEYTRDIWQSPHRSIYRLAWLCLTGRLSDKDVRRLYSCTLCNKCWLAPFNRITRDMAVGRGIVPPHLAAIRGHIDGTGNPYGVLRDGGSPEQEDRCDTLLFVGCTGRYRTPEIIEAARKLLASKGIKHYTMPDETCCGYTLYNLGDRQSAEKAISANLAKFKASGVRRIVTVCPGCYTALTSLYRGREGFDADVFLALDLLQGLSAEARDAVVHDPCHAKGRHDLVRKMAKGAPDEGTGGCCGAGGGLISWDSVMAGSRARTIMGESGRKVITYCPLCYLNFKRADPAGVSDLYVLLASHGVSQPD